MISSFKEEDYIKENCDCAVMPMDAESGRRVSIYNGLGWAAAANGDNTENAWKLIEYLGSEAAQTNQAELGVTMSAWDGTSEAWVNCAPEFNLQAYLDMRDDMVIRPYSEIPLHGKQSQRASERGLGRKYDHGRYLQADCRRDERYAGGRAVT